METTILLSLERKVGTISFVSSHTYSCCRYRILYAIFTCTCIYIFDARITPREEEHGVHNNKHVL